MSDLEERERSAFAPSQAARGFDEEERKGSDNGARPKWSSLTASSNKVLRTSKVISIILKKTHNVLKIYNLYIFFFE